MTAMSVHEMRSVDGGARASYTVKCNYCGKKYTATSFYIGRFLYQYAYNSCKVAAGRWKRNHRDQHTLDAIRSFGY